MNYAVSESSVNVQCPRVNVTIWEGNSTYVSRRTGTSCGRELPRPFIGRGSVVISYNYQPIYENYGFRVQYGKFGESYVTCKK